MLINSPNISGSLKVTGNSVMTGSLTVTGQVIAQTLNVQQVTSSIIYSSGSNVFGNSLANTQQFTGSVSVTGSLSVNNTPAVLGSGTTNYVTKFTTAGTVGNSGIFESGSNVGIGTTTLSEKVNIDGNILLRSAGGIKFNRLDNAIFTHLYDAGTFFALDNRNGNGFDFQSAGTSQMRLNSAGNLGISGSITSLSDSDELSFFAGTTLVDNRSRIELYGPTHATLANQTFIRGNQIVFTSDSATPEHMRITSNDIRLSRPLFGSEYGFISALAPVHIVQNAYYDGSTWRSYQAGNSIVIQHSTSSTNIFGVGLAVGTGVNSAITFNYLFNVGANGNVLIGTTTDIGYKIRMDSSSTNGNILWVDRSPGSVQMFMTPSSDFYISTNNSFGVVLNVGATSWSAYSDIRLKNITGKITDALTNVLTLSPIRFTLKSDETKKERIGLIAQEIQKILPEAVDSDDKGMLSVRYTEIIPLLVASIQEQQIQIQTLKVENNTLKETLTSELQSIKDSLK
jgi:hypothetical protein